MVGEVTLGIVAVVVASFIGGWIAARTAAVGGWLPALVNTFVVWRTVALFSPLLARTGVA